MSAVVVAFTAYSSGLLHCWSKCFNWKRRFQRIALHTFRRCFQPEWSCSSGGQLVSRRIYKLPLSRIAWPLLCRFVVRLCCLSTFRRAFVNEKHSFECVLFFAICKLQSTLMTNAHYKYIWNTHTYIHKILEKILAHIHKIVTHICKVALLSSSSYKFIRLLSNFHHRCA